MTDCPGCGEPCETELCQECEANQLTPAERHPPRPVFRAEDLSPIEPTRRRDRDD